MVEPGPVPRVSVIIPTYNRAGLLRMALESVLAQTHSSIQVIVVDDGSTDETAGMLAEYSGRVTHIRQANAGISRARNHGLEVAQGDYINFLDDDDTMMPRKIERQAAVLAARPEVGLVHCRYCYLDRAGQPLGRVGLLPQKDVLRELLLHNFMWMGGPLIRRDCLGRVGAFDVGLSAAADYDLWLRIAAGGFQFACIQEPLGGYRVHRGSMVTDIARVEQDVMIALDKAFASPYTPADLATIRDRSYGTWYSWLARRYYSTGDWRNGQRSLAMALALCPQLLENRGELLQAFCDEALDPRTDDPLGLADRLYNHLPPVAEELRPYRADLLSRMHAGLALRDYGSGKLADAREQLSQSISLYPTMLDHPGDFGSGVVSWAMRTPETSESYLATVFDNLPGEAQGLRRAQRAALGGVAIARAFEDYCAGRYRLAVVRILTALRYRPSLARNRGVISVFARSLLGRPGERTGG